MSAEEWSDSENDVIVADYFRMLADELAGNQFNKAAHNRALQKQIGRSKGSIEFKHQNISAVLVGLNETWIKGYRPASNYQMSLAEAVARHLHQVGGWLVPTLDNTMSGFSEISSLISIGTAPTLKNSPPPKELEQIQMVARKFDAAGRDERNRILGHAGERCVVLHERSVLNDAGRGDLAEKVRWVSQEDGDGAGYDISSFTAEGQERLIEVKTTNGWERSPFYISKNELEVSESRRNAWTLFRLWDFSREPKAFELRTPLNAHVELIATQFQANFN